jgi:hypothetical protein
MTREHEDLSPGCPEISAIEASLAQLRPRHQPRFADQLKNRMKDMLSGRTQPTGHVTATVRIPLTHYIRIARFHAAAGGLLVGLFLGMLLGGAGVFWALSRREQTPSQHVLVPYSARLPYVRLLLEDDLPLTPLERAILDEMNKESRDDRTR